MTAVAVDFAVRCQVSTQKEHTTPGHAKRGRAKAGVMVEPSSPQSSAVSPSEAKPSTKSKKYVQLAVLWVT